MNPQLDTAWERVVAARKTDLIPQGIFRLDPVFWGTVRTQIEARAEFTAAAQRHFGQGTSVEWTPHGCIVARVMEFLYETQEN